MHLGFVRRFSIHASLWAGCIVGATEAKQQPAIALAFSKIRAESTGDWQTPKRRLFIDFCQLEELLNNLSADSSSELTSKV
eukprot:3212462-Amphidinium_carterae.1